MMDIILASGSPRRHELLTKAKVDFTIMSVDIDEAPYQDESPKDYIERMVATKAAAAIAQLNTELKTSQKDNATPQVAIAKPTIILTADTIGVLPDGKTVLVKPKDFQHASTMWQQMSDDTHQVWTAVQATLVSVSVSDDGTTDTGIDANSEPLQVLWQRQITERTEVTFIPLSQAMMERYWHSGEPKDKAGGYGIQGLAAAWVTHINGSYTNVVGLPLAQTLALIDAAQSRANVESR